MKNHFSHNGKMFHGYFQSSVTTFGWLILFGKICRLVVVQASHYYPCMWRERSGERFLWIYAVLPFSWSYVTAFARDKIHYRPVLGHIMSASPNLCEVLRLRREDSWRRLVNKLGYLAGPQTFISWKYQTTRNLNNSINFNNDTSCGHYWIPPRFLLLCLGDHSVPRLEDNFERKVRICFLLQQDSASNIKVYVLLHNISPFTH